MTVFQNVLARLSSASYVTNYRCPLVNRISTSIFQYSPKQSIEEKLGIKPRPKRPTTPFIRYSSQQRTNIIQQNPHASPKEIVKLLSEEWKKLDESVKTKLQADFKKEWQTYLEECKDYDKLLSPQDKEDIAIAKEKVKQAKENKILKKQKEDLGCPKKPASSYVNFMRSKLPERGNTPFIEFQKKVKEDWDKLPEVEKDRFEQSYHKEMEEYRQKMALWMKKMDEEGKFIPTKKEKVLDGIKKPGSSYIYFMRSRLLERGETPFREFQKQLRDEWEKLPASEKKKYEDERSKEMEEYKVKIGKLMSRKETKARKELSTPVSESVKCEILDKSEDLKKGNNTTVERSTADLSRDQLQVKEAKIQLSNEKQHINDPSKDSNGTSTPSLQEKLNQTKIPQQMETKKVWSHSEDMIQITLIVTSTISLGFLLYLLMFY